MRLIKLVYTLLLVAIAAPSAMAADANRTSITAILVIASNERGATDPRLAPYEANLKRTLRYESFRFGGEGSASVAGGATASISLPNNNRLDLEAEKSDGRGVRVRVHYGSTDVVIPPGKTVIVAGRPSGPNGEISAVIVTAN
jgi:hypothetical protein